MRVPALVLLALVTLACRYRLRDAEIETVDSTSGGSDETSTGAAQSTSSTGDDWAEGGGGGGGEGGLKLDVGGVPDVGPGACTSADIPETCAQAAACATTVGCEFFGVDLDQLDIADDNQFAIVVANVQRDVGASVTVEQKVGGIWEVVAGPEPVDPLGEHTFELDDLHQEGSGILVGGAYRVTSDVPVVAYQFNPLDLDGDGASSDATVLYPVRSWDTQNAVVGWRPHPFQPFGAYFTVAAAYDGTVVQIVPSTGTLPGPGVPEGIAGEAFEIELSAGDVVEVMTRTDGETLTGTRVVSNAGHPVALFSGGECAFVLDHSCDHVEIQLSGVRRWGLDFVAARVPPRVDPPEVSMWQIYASEDDTTIDFEAEPGVTGLPAASITLDAGEVHEVAVGGDAAAPGDFRVVADRPIALVNYMVGSALADSIGDPAMVQLPPLEQLLPRYVVLVPVSWDIDIATLIRPAGAQIRIDGDPVADDAFVPVGTGWEVARIPLSDGVHDLDGDQAFGVTIVGTTAVDSYAYVGGVGTQVINPTPEG